MEAAEKLAAKHGLPSLAEWLQTTEGSDGLMKPDGASGKSSVAEATVAEMPSITAPAPAPTATPGDSGDAEHGTSSRSTPEQPQAQGEASAKYVEVD